MAQANLYPPRIDKLYQKVFLNNEACKVYFAMPSYLSIDDINLNYMQVSVVSQSTNKNALKNKCGVTLKKIQVDSSSATDKYYITISVDDIADEYLEESNEVKCFKTNSFYQVQLRFTSKDAYSSGINNYGPIDRVLISWLEKNKDYFSEWSTITLCKAIYEPTLQIDGVVEGAEAPRLDLNANDLTVSGSVTFKQDNSQVVERLVSYDINLTSITGYNENLASGIIKSDNFSNNVIFYKFDRLLPDGAEYYLQIHYVTSGGYEAYSEPIIVKVRAKSAIPFPGTLKATPINSESQIRIDIYGNNPDIEFDGLLTIKRTSGDSDFQKWEDVANISMNGGYSIYWIDSLCESQIWYRYAAQLTYTDSELGTVTTKLLKMEEPVQVYAEDGFLINNYTQLKVRYNLQLSSFKYVVKDSITETIGSQFPFITRNGQVKYRSFPISGLIARSMDDRAVFTSYKELFPSEEVRKLNKEFNFENRIYSETDYIKERKFREKVMDFLYSPDGFLFKSPTEGNIIVKITDVTFSPIESLDRRLYTFSANATEIAPYTIENCDYYKIQKSSLDILHDWVIISNRYNKVFHRDDVTQYMGGYQRVKNEDGKIVGDFDEKSKAKYGLILTKEYLLSGNTKNYGLNIDYQITNDGLVSTLLLGKDDKEATYIVSTMKYTGLGSLNEEGA